MNITVHSATVQTLSVKLSAPQDTVTALREDVGQKEREVDELRKSLKQVN